MSFAVTPSAPSGDASDYDLYHGSLIIHPRSCHRAPEIIRRIKPHSIHLMMGDSNGADVIIANLLSCLTPTADWVPPKSVAISSDNATNHSMFAIADFIDTHKDAGNIRHLRINFRNISDDARTHLENICKRRKRFTSAPNYFNYRFPEPIEAWSTCTQNGIVYRFWRRIAAPQRVVASNGVTTYYDLNEWYRVTHIVWLDDPHILLFENGAPSRLYNPFTGDVNHDATTLNALYETVKHPIWPKGKC